MLYAASNIPFRVEVENNLECFAYCFTNLSLPAHVHCVIVCVHVWVDGCDE